MAVAAEFEPKLSPRDYYALEFDVEPLVTVVPETIQDEATRLQARHFIGQVMLQRTVEPANREETQSVGPIESLYEALRLAKAGNEQARKIVEANVRAEGVEITIKSGHITEVELTADETGEIQQHGQSMRSVQANSLRFASTKRQIRERTEAETTNAFRLNQAYKAGELENKSFVVFSRAADNMPEEEMKGLFFTDTMSCSIQATTKRNGRLVTETAFVSGLKEPGSGSAFRHDEQTIVRVGECLGINVAGKSATEMIDTPWLVDNALLPNGGIDLVEMYDDCADGTFFGENQPRQDYLEYKQQCLLREQSYEAKVQAAVSELVTEAGTIQSRLDAIERLHKITEKHMVHQALHDTRIDPRVFGDVAAADLREARFYLQQGNHQLAVAYEQRAINNAASFSCPGAYGGMGNAELAANAGSEGDCTYTSKKCPECGKPNVLTTVKAIPETNLKHISGSCGCSVVR